MPDGLDFLYRPVARGYYLATALLDCSIDLEHIAECNMAIDVEDENRARLAEANK